jgi:hypothetical protein
MLRSIVTLLSCALFAATASPTAAFAEDSAGSPASSGRGSGPEEVPDNAELARRLDILAREVDDMKLGEVAGGPDSRYGFGPAASKVYSVGRGVSIGGYGEMLYEDFATENESGDPVSSRDRIDFLRQIVYLGYKFDDRLLFNSEIEFEHASTSLNGSVAVEFAYLDALFRPEVNARAGMLLVPMGFVNELHEPPVFLGARRPESERVIVPTTWRANGAGIFGEPVAGVTYRAYVIEGLRATGFGAGGLRSGRQNGSQALIEDAAVVLRVDWESADLAVGGSVFHGNAGQGDTTADGSTFDAGTTIYEGHAQFRRNGLQLRGLFTGARVRNAASINDAKEVAPGSSSSVGSKLRGWYLEGGYDVLTRFSPGSGYQLIPYMRYEELDTQADVPAGFLASPANDRQILTAGIGFYPHAQVVVKADFQRNTNEAKTGTDQWNLALGYLF